MFNLREFIVKNIVNGIKNGTFSKEYGNIMSVNYLLRGVLTEEDIAVIDAEITAWEIAKAEEKRLKEEAMNTPVVIPEILPEDEVIENEIPVEEKITETETETVEEPVEEVTEEPTV